jgi:hypothetical protein
MPADSHLSAIFRAAWHPSETVTTARLAMLKAHEQVRRAEAALAIARADLVVREQELRIVEAGID